MMTVEEIKKILDKDCENPRHSFYVIDYVDYIYLIGSDKKTK